MLEVLRELGTFLLLAIVTDDRVKLWVRSGTV